MAGIAEWSNQWTQTETPRQIGGAPWLLDMKRDRIKFGVAVAGDVFGRAALGRWKVSRWRQESSATRLAHQASTVDIDLDIHVNFLHYTIEYCAKPAVLHC